MNCGLPKETQDHSKTSSTHLLEKKAKMAMSEQTVSMANQELRESPEQVPTNCGLMPVTLELQKIF